MSCLEKREEERRNLWNFSREIEGAAAKERDEKEGESGKKVERILPGKK